jgi:hypothetical protein
MDASLDTEFLWLKLFQHTGQLPLPQSPSLAGAADLSPGFEWLRGGFRVALGWLWGRNPLAINTLWGGFDVALGGFPQPIASISAFCFLLLPDWPFCLLHSAFCLRFGVALDGFARIFEVRGSGFDVGCWMLDVRCWMLRSIPFPDFSL